MHRRAGRIGVRPALLFGSMSTDGRRGVSMRRLTRTAIGATLALLMVAAVATPGLAAVPGPRREQWWFTAWAVQNKVWPITQGDGVTVAVIDTGVQASIRSE